MVKQLMNVSTYAFTKNNRKYFVTIERIGNTPCGNPRFEARIISNDCPYPLHEYCFTVKYRFSGHYYDEHAEAEWILEEHLKRTQ